MNITIINDCRDANAAGRQSARATALMGGPVSYIGVQNDIEAAGNLIDSIDAYGDAPGTILVNVAPRNGKAKKWKNGTPFGYMRYKNLLIVASVDGLTLSLVKKLNLVKESCVLDIPTCVQRFVSEKIIDQDVGQHIVATQFRSYDFLPRVAAYLNEHTDIEHEILSIDTCEDAPAAVWWVDSFGNCKTTLLEGDIEKKAQVELKVATLPYFERLKDVPDTTTAIITGSSGLKHERFLEIVAQGGHAANLLHISSGDLII